MNNKKCTQLKIMSICKCIRKFSDNILQLSRAIKILYLDVVYVLCRYYVGVI